MNARYSQIMEVISDATLGHPLQLSWYPVTEMHVYGDASSSLWNMYGTLKGRCMNAGFISLRLGNTIVMEHFVIDCDTCTSVIGHKFRPYFSVVATYIKLLYFPSAIV